MTKGEAICQEFCDEVLVVDTVVEAELGTFRPIAEIKCRVDIKYFTPLMERMVQIGFCCTQVQKDLKGHHCTIWFEPMSREEVV